jgi:hypothetical protein
MSTRLGFGRGLVSVDPQTFPEDDMGRLVTFPFTGDVVQYRVTEIEASLLLKD